jgi:hypothetical protein
MKTALTVIERSKRSSSSCTHEWEEVMQMEDPSNENWKNIQN